MILRERSILVPSALLGDMMDGKAVDVHIRGAGPLSCHYRTKQDLGRALSTYLGGSLTHLEADLFLTNPLASINLRHFGVMMLTAV